MAIARAFCAERDDLIMSAIGTASGDCNADRTAVTGLMVKLLSGYSGQAAEAALEHMATGGKGLRTNLALHSAEKLGLGSRTAIAIAAASELIHNASLVHDDIHDRSEKRRGCLSLWARHGADIAICSGDVMISAAYGALATAKGAYLSDAIVRMHHRVSEVIAGQSADLAAKDAATITLAHYKQIAAAKSAPLLCLPIELSLILAGRAHSTELLEQAARLFAIGYQMADDIEDAAADISNGRVNIVGILARETEPEEALSVARTLASKTYGLASDLASELPSGCGELMAALAADCAEKMQIWTLAS